jgi:OFA family oxalate/formate antiporter-like MFS transporter
VANVPVTIVDLTLPALAFALAIDRVFSGLARPFFGGVSDLIGREKAMFIAFGVEALAIIAIAHFGHDPLMFVLLTGVIFFAWGEIYSLFPAACADTFGPDFAATHAGMLHTARGAAALLMLMVSAWLPPAADWHGMIYGAAGLNAAAAILAVFSLKPLRARQRAADRATHAASVRG